MRIKTKLGIIGILAACLVATNALATDLESAPLFLELEGGAVWQSSNDVQIPNDATGTRFSLVDVIGEGPWPAFRLYATWNISAKHGLRVLLAPLTITETAPLPGAVDFAGRSYVAGEPTEATYQFNSWRLSYRYRFHHGDDWTWWIGFTAKLRDAKVRLQQGTVASEKTDLGFVPLLHLAGTWRFSDSWSANLDADALAGGPGRAVDASFKFRYRFSDRWSLAAGYRTVEGGADVDEVYNFAWLHYAVASVGLAF
jgi:hypothetical protein